jgi:uncharacterized membrane protein YoaK (UPF0700 family)
MKKNILFLLAIAVMSLASCKKNRTCTCTTTTSPGSTSSTTIDTESHLTKKEAKRVLNCYSYTSTSSYVNPITGASTSVVTTVACTLK